MTWDFAYEIKVHEVHGGDICLSLLVKPSYKENCINMLEEYGYKNIQTENEPVGVIELYNIDDEDVLNMSTVIVD